MDGDRWQKIEHLFHAAVALDKPRRDALLRRACADDESLGWEVASLLEQADQASSFLEIPAMALVTDSGFHNLRPASLSRGSIVETGALQSDRTVSIAELTGSFPQTPRFVLRHCLGAGGFGTVYEAYDRELNAVVALKALRRGGPASHSSFKQEFRALGDIVHPNLVALYELIVENEQCFFTMELVRGLHFLHYIRGSDPLKAPAARIDFDRLKACFGQLAEGVNALHQAGKLHCDLKPSNVLIDKMGRLVILDFGLITSSDSVEALAQRNSLVGTPQYMSPEQLNGSRLSPASDWYSAGVMLFEALTGQRPFKGSLREIIEQRLRLDPPAPVDLIENVPSDLNELCCSLLARDPASRPKGIDILQFLGIKDSRANTSSLTRVDPGTPFVGRDPELSILQDCFRQAGQNQMVTVLVHGPSGMGKTALVQHFLRELRRINRPVILEGRCYEKEAIPYNAIDGIVECLDSHLKGLSPSEATEMLPAELSALKSLFPSIKESGWANQPGQISATTADSSELRRQGLTALCEIISNISKKKMVVLFIDDLQRGDADSADLLNGLIAGSNTARVLLVGCYRSEEAHSSPLLSRLLPLKRTVQKFPFLDLALEELDEFHARSLATALFERDGALTSVRPETIAREAKGHPLFIGELVLHAQAQHADSASRSSEASGPLSINDVIRSRTLSLPPQAERLLRVVAVAGQPIDTSLACRAAEIDTGGQAELHLLRAVNLVRTRKTEMANQVEAYHDRIQEVVQASLDEGTLKQTHYRIAVEHERSADAEPRTLAAHFLSAGVPDKALSYANKAAEKARAVLAFGAASESCRLALRAVELLPECSERDAQEMTVRQALVAMLQLTEGWGAPEIIDAVKRATSLAERSADLKQFTSWIGSRSFTAWIAADLSTSLTLADQALELNLRQRSATAVPYLFVQQLMTRFWLGDHAGAESSLRIGSPYFQDPSFRRNVVGSVIALFAYASWNAWMLGRADLARERLLELVKAVNVNNPHDLVFAGHHTALVLSHLGQPDQAEMLALWALQLAQEHQFPNEAAMARAALGLTRTWLGGRNDCVQLLREGVADMAQAGQRLGTGLYTQSLAFAYARTGVLGEALKTIDYALSENFNEPVFRPEALRLRAELRMTCGDAKSAEADVLKAISMAQANGAKALELRAAMTLARLWNGTSHAHEGRQALANVYDSFTEGFDTPDLKEAKTLLGQLAR